MKYLIYYMLLILGTILFMELLKLLADSRKKPYVVYPFSDEETAIVVFYQFSRNEQGSYTKYYYKKREKRWHFVIDKCDLAIWLVIYGILLLGLFLIALRGEFPSVAFGIHSVITVTIVITIIGVFYPVKGYLFLRKKLI